MIFKQFQHKTIYVEMKSMKNLEFLVGFPLPLTVLVKRDIDFIEGVGKLRNSIHKIFQIPARDLYFKRENSLSVIMRFEGGDHLLWDYLSSEGWGVIWDHGDCPSGVHGIERGEYRGRNYIIFRK